MPKCYVHSCQLQGVATDERLPGSETSWFCRFHFSNENPPHEVSSRIHKFVSQLEYVYKIKTAGAHYWKTHPEMLNRIPKVQFEGDLVKYLKDLGEFETRMNYYIRNGKQMPEAISAAH